MSQGRLRTYYSNFSNWIKSFSNWIKRNFTIDNGKLILLAVFFLNKSECESLKMVSSSKKQYAYNWYFNNVVYSLIIIFLPYLFTLIHRSFGTIAYNKGMIDIALSGSLSLTGLNILRSASTMIAEKLDESKLYEQNKEAWSHVKQEIMTIKNKLSIALYLLTILGTLSYVFQVVALVNNSNPAVYWFLVGFVVIFMYSILIGRSIYLMNGSFTDNEEVIRIWYSKRNEQSKQMITDVRSQATIEGL